MRRPLKLAFFAAALSMLAACSGVYRTAYDAPVPASVSRGWTVRDVTVTVPETLTVSEDRVYIPDADIVWREDPPGDRKAQIAAIMRDAVRRGAAPLRGPRPVRLLVDMRRFHALTFEAEWRAVNGGVHNIDFVITVVDARNGAVLVGPLEVEADTPAFSGPAAVTARSNGLTQKSVITDHVAETIAGWLGVGPDNRGEFTRAGD